MTCRELTAFLDGFLSAELPDRTMRAFERHLTACANCRQYLAGYEAAIRSGRQAFDDAFATVPGDVPEPLVQAILQARLAQ